MSDVLDWTAGPFLELYATLAAIALVVALTIKEWVKERSSGVGSAGDLTVIELALLSGGPARAADAIALGLIEAGHLAVMPDGTLRATTAPLDGPPELVPFHIEEQVARARLIELMRPWYEPALQDLIERGLALSDAQLTRIRLQTACAILPVIVLGLLKVVIGLGRNKPVGILVMLLVATAVAGVMIAHVSRLATGLGESALSQLSKAKTRALRAPLPQEVVFAFAVEGATVLEGTALASYATALKGKPDGGGCGGGGDGGGGCGGCGGD